MEDSDVFEFFIKPERCSYCGILVVDKTLKQLKPPLCRKCKVYRDRGDLVRLVYEKKTPNYDISSSKETTSPIIRLTEEGMKKSALLMHEMVRDTEDYRINRLFRIARSHDTDLSVRIRCIGLLLECYIVLPIQMGVDIINLVNRLMQAENTPDDIKVKLATVMRKFNRPSSTASKKTPVTYEELRMEGEDKGIIEIEDTLV